MPFLRIRRENQNLYIEQNHVQKNKRNLAKLVTNVYYTTFG
jgi:phenylpyruvate tautomerase PptA (4-oxalocrotonate tautomerase family)